ncbi:DNA repair exonuclease [Linderina pennispora]|uniref:Double-strand break repair protein n=1 Tax=Linderina pennispora TaxID=61395 RepID=A0A1Y1WLR3_9FUNG|nr:DNA repair exonuclease [Linderina pennispora]ORX74305.1 DNA repair exonuclease [Linderina pennispora]
MAPPRDLDSISDTDTFNILVATDNHLGYMERDPIRGQDSFLAFEEILQLAQSHSVDMILLGGDMFHDNKPSRKCLHQSMAMLRKYFDFGSQFPQVNYEDPNFNVSLPVFSIHGNHDDPSGDGNLGLVNYFGRQSEVENIRVSPVLLKKGYTQLALFGLGNVRDERLHRTIERKNMTMCRPEEDAEKWFNLMVLHQNRVAHGPKSHIPEHFLSKFLDLVVWGHEHQCQIDPEFNPQQSFFVSQPGSSVATALSSGEAVEKHVAVLKVNRRNFKIDKIRLKNVRPFVIEDVVLSEESSLSPQSSEDEIVDFLRDRVEEMIEKAERKYRDQVKEGSPDVPNGLGDSPKPLIRVRVEYSGGFESFHPQRFGLLFADRVANPRDIIHFFRKAKAVSRSESTASRVVPSVPQPVETVQVESLISEFLDESSMRMLVDVELAEALRLFVQKGDSDAISQSLIKTIGDVQKQVLGYGEAVDSESLEVHIGKVQQERRQQAKENGEHLAVVSGSTVVAAATTGTKKKSGVTVADAKAIKEFEITAKKPGSYGEMPDPYEHDDGDDEDLREAGERLSSKGVGKDENDDESGDESDEMKSQVSQRPAPAPRVARPSRTARSTVAYKGESAASESEASHLSDAPKLQQQWLLTIATATFNGGDNTASTPEPKRRRAAKAPVAATRGRGRGRGRGKAAMGRGASKLQFTQNSNQMPAINIDDDDDDDDDEKPKGFGQFSLRKK